VTAPLRRLSLVLSLAFLAAHAVRLPETLEDIDSINFAMGVERFDVAAHRPHPPGYPVFVVLAKATTAGVSAGRPGWDRDQIAAGGLAVLALIAGALAIPVFTAFWRALGVSSTGALLAAATAAAAPLFWLTASRPLSDTPGLVAAVAVQTLLVRAFVSIREGDAMLPRAAIVGAVGAGFAVGLRSQTVWLTGPLLLSVLGLLLWHRRAGQALRVLTVSALGALLWALPLVWTAGGLSPYLQAFAQQTQEDFAGVQMLATTPSWSLFEAAIGRTFVDPWQMETFAHVVLALSLGGLGVLAWRRRPALALIVVAFVPYLVFHLAFQETVTIRYALPLIVPVAGLAIVALEALGPYAAAIGATWLIAVSLAFATPRLDLYVRDGAPLSRAFREMRIAWDASEVRPVLNMHHQVWWGVRRIIDWYRPVWDLGPQPFPGDREWLATVEHFRAGHTRPVWFLGHVSRPGLPMFDARAADRSLTYLFPRDLQKLIGGARVDSLIWHSVQRPGWMLSRGWSLTPELAGMTAEDRKASRVGAPEAYVRRRPGPQRLLIGGRYLGTDHGPPVEITVSIDERPVGRFHSTPNPRWFVHWIDLPNGTDDGQNAYARLVVDARSTDSADATELVGLEQFDAASVNAPMFAFMTGWHESEANPTTGQSWRWTSEASSIEIRGMDGDRKLIVTGESPLRYFERPPKVTVRAGDRVLGTFSPAADFSETIALPAAAVSAVNGRLTIEKDLTFRPSQTGSADRRVLGLRLYSVSIQ
jgi:hypothetical protein